MGLLILLIVLYNVFGKSNPAVYHFVHEKLGKIIGMLVVLGIATSALPSLLGATIALAICASPFIGIAWIIKHALGIGKSREKYKESPYTGDDRRANVAFSAREERRKSPLPKSVSKRRKIVAKFNEEYDLNLTDEEIDRIVDSSYASIEWEVEIYAMSRDYDSVNEWYRGMTGFVRAYMRAFAVQQITSDFRMQEKICLDSFDQIFREIKPETYPSIDACVKAIKNRYMTMFDETTFMIAYRFLQSRGRNYQLPSAVITSSYSEIDRLKEKYDGVSETSNTGEDDLDKMSAGYDADNIDALMERYDADTKKRRSKEPS